MPINGLLHWSTAVFCNMNTLKAFWNGDNSIDGSPVPCLLHLDSFPGSHMAEPIAKIARQVALDEWILFSADRLATTTGAELLLLRVRYDVIVSRLKELAVVSPIVPLQPNVVDCGVHHVALVEDITMRYFSVTASDLLSSPPCDRHYSSRLFEQSSIEVSRDFSLHIFRSATNDTYACSHCDFRCGHFSRALDWTNARKGTMLMNGVDEEDANKGK